MSKTAIVTGAGSGIGRASAIALSRAGWRVAFAGRRAEPLESAAKECGAPPGHTLATPVDVRNAASVAALFAKVRSAFGRLDLLFNNAGVSSPAVAFEDITLDQWQAVVDTNLTGMFLCAQEAVRMMKSQTPRGGRIINNGSIAAYTPRPHSAPYAATKHAVLGLTKCLSLDGRAHDIACGQIDIGNAATELAAKMVAGMPQSDGSVRSEPVLDLEHVAQAVVQMAGLPLEANVQYMTLMATKMPYVGRG